MLSHHSKIFEKLILKWSPLFLAYHINLKIGFDDQPNKFWQQSREQQFLTVKKADLNDNILFFPLSIYIF